MSTSTTRQPKGIPAGGQFAATIHTEPDTVHLLGRPDDDFEDAVQKIGFHVMAANRWKDEAMDGLMGRGSFDHSQLCITAWRAVDRAGLRELEKAKLHPEMYEFRDRGMDRYEKHLPAALDMVEGKYREALGKVGNGGLLDATELDVTRKALRYEIDQLQVRPDEPAQG
ncbi:hypothetical protein [Paenarthrobacter sp. YJN-5]|uniref:hypothetical protein n=1 Tax=Paenarthrobacter sp. YJN-5 TaxID=2735316 RepID=UPI0018784561|nr:hypothetical protein [Paenarthrobacter sp. YJN-5]QOT19641.1 hypothetical protein HMI59_23805 [Paenarthrobacter sp. YJN-5]